MELAAAAEYDVAGAGVDAAAAEKYARRVDITFLGELRVSPRCFPVFPDSSIAIYVQ